MRLSLDPSVIAARNVTAESSALAKWYDAKPTVQRLWGIREAQILRVVVSLEPTLDSDDVFPAWVANRHNWAHELHLLTGRSVQLVLLGESPPDGIEFHAGSVIVADLFWRDATLVPPGPDDFAVRAEVNA